MPKSLKFFPEVIVLSNQDEAEQELVKIGCDPSGIKIMKDKALFFVIKIKSLTPAQANIIKQDMLSLGGEAATARGTINDSIACTDILICGTLSQYKKLIKKFSGHSFSLPQLSKALEESISNFLSFPSPLKIGNKKLDFKKRTYIMGILNVTPDSFSDGGLYFDTKKAIKHAEDMINEGADIIDIGGESTRPGSTPIPKEEELKRILPVVKYLTKHNKCLISVDTQKSFVAQKALSCGAHIINDISALRNDANMAKIIAKYKATVILMHMQGNPLNMQQKPNYNDIIYEISEFLEKRVEFAQKAGILSQHIIVDPGFGFGKTLKDNLCLLHRLKEFKVLGKPLLVGTSRKSMIGKILGLKTTEKRIIGTAATTALAILNGANIIRVHDVAETKEVVKIVDAVRTEGGR